MSNIITEKKLSGTKITVGSGRSKTEFYFYGTTTSSEKIAAFLTEKLENFGNGAESLVTAINPRRRRKSKSQDPEASLV